MEGVIMMFETCKGSRFELELYFKGYVFKMDQVNEVICCGEEDNDYYLLRNSKMSN